MNKKTKITILFLLIILLTGCSKIIKFENIKQVRNGFHQINVAEKVNDGILYYDGDRVLYDINDNKTEIATEVKSLWREDNDIYYVSKNILYNYNLKSKETKRLVDKPHTILGKYNDKIISYSGSIIYSIDGTKKSKLFKDGYYLNSAVLYKNKVYGIPATNVYEYNLDTLEVNKVTKNPRNSYMKLINDDLWIVTTNKNKKKNNYTYYKMEDNKLKKVFTIKNVEYVFDEANTKDGMVIKTSKSFSESVKGNRLIYVQNDKIRNIDKNNEYEVIGIYNDQLCYYKNNYVYGTDQKNLKTFYLYNGKRSNKAFDLNVDYYDDIEGYEYNSGLLIAVIYEMNTKLYKYDGKTIEEVKQPNNLYRIISIDIIDNEAYIKYSDGEESLSVLGSIIDLK